MAKVLVVDDERINLRLVRMTLETAGHETTSTQQPTDVEEILNSQSFDAIIIDILMPKMTGWDLLERLRANPRTHNTPIMMLSGFGDTPTRVKGLRSGADDFMVKPFDPDELLARLESLIARSARKTPLLSGQFESQSMFDLLQMLASGKKTGSFHILTRDTVGNMLLLNGTLVKGTYGDRRGLAAIETMLRLERGMFQFNHLETVQESERQIEEGLEKVVINLVWLLDEISLRQKFWPSRDHALTAHGTIDDAGDMPEEIPAATVLERVTQSPGITVQTILNIPDFSIPRLELSLLCLLEQGLLTADKT